MRALGITCESPHRTERGSGVQGHRQGMGSEQAQHPELLPPDWSPSHCFARPPEAGLSFLKVIFSNRGVFSLLSLGTPLFYLKIAKEIGKENPAPRKLQTKTIQVKAQKSRELHPGKPAFPAQLNMDAAVGQSQDGSKRNGEALPVACFFSFLSFSFWRGWSKGFQ